jgi:hypothetical protein
MKAATALAAPRTLAAYGATAFKAAEAAMSTGG